MTKHLVNAFSAGMLPAEGAVAVFAPLDQAQARAEAVGATSAVGHADTLRLFNAALGIEFPLARVSVALTRGDRLILGQYSGPRLPEGATSLPAGASIRWMLVTVLAMDELATDLVC